MKSIRSSGPYNLVGYSFGAPVALEMALQLQQHHYHVTSLTLLDASHATIAMYTRLMAEKLKVTTNEDNDQSRTEAATVLRFMANVLHLDAAVMTQVRRFARLLVSAEANYLYGIWKFA